MIVWQNPVPPLNEAARIRALAELELVDAEDDRFDRLSRLTSLFYNADAAFVGFIDADYQWLISRSTDQLPSCVARKDTVCNVMIATAKPLVVGDLWSDERMTGHPTAGKQPLRFYAGVPLIVGPDLVIGSLCVMKHDPADAATFDLGPLLDFAAIAMDEIELWARNRELAHLSETDALTGIANRRGFDSAIERALRRASRSGDPLALLLLDIDHFKPFNDRLGHQAGDEALRLFASVVAGVVQRPYDQVARYGGEEFAVILPDTDLDGAMHVAAEIRLALAAANIPHPSGGALTASVGVAVFDSPLDATPARLISSADGALYAAKAAGRNRAVAAPVATIWWRHAPKIDTQLPILS